MHNEQDTDTKKKRLRAITTTYKTKEQKTRKVRRGIFGIGGKYFLKWARNMKQYKAGKDQEVGRVLNRVWQLSYTVARGIVDSRV